MRRLQTRSQFQTVMAGGVVAKTAHFALHRLSVTRQPPAAPLDPLFAAPKHALPCQLPAGFPPESWPGAWLGAMVPKRWAKRAVTRNALKRQIYAVSTELSPRLPLAAWVVRLRAPFDRQEFVSACSERLKLAARTELMQLFSQVLRP